MGLILNAGGVGGAPQVATGIGVPPRTAGGVGTQQNPYQPSPNYQYGPIDPYGINYNYDYMRYGPPGVGVSPWNPIVQAQLNLGMRTARYNLMQRLVGRHVPGGQSVQSTGHGAGDRESAADAGHAAAI